MTDPRASTVEEVEGAIAILVGAWRGVAPIVATLVERAPRRLTADGPAVGQDGRCLLIHAERWLALTPRERAMGFARAALRLALHHPRRRGDRDPARWHVAAELVVGEILAGTGGEVAPGRGLEGKSVEEVYLLLGADGGAPEGDLVPDAEDRGEGSLDRGFAGASGEPGEGAGEDVPGAVADADASWREAFERATAGARGGPAAGLAPAGRERAVESLPPHLDWRVVLWRFVARTPTDYGGFDRRFLGRGLYLDALAQERLRVLVAVDTSRSVAWPQLARFTAELQAILCAYPHVRCTLFYADGALHGAHELRGQGVPPTPVGGGGTDFRPFFQEVAERVGPADQAVVVYLTDGDGVFPTRAPSPPVLWVVPSGGRPIDTFPFGEVVPLLD